MQLVGEDDDILVTDEDIEEPGRDHDLPIRQVLQGSRKIKQVHMQLQSLDDIWEALGIFKVHKCASTE